METQRLAELQALESLRPAHGFPDETCFDTLSLAGWILLPDHKLSWVAAYLDGVPVGSAAVAQPRPDVAKIYHRSPHADKCGFTRTFAEEVTQGLIRIDRALRLTLVGFDGDRPLARLRTVIFPDQVAPPVPIPPPALVEEIQGDEDPVNYKTLGYRFYCQILDLITRWRDPRSLRTILDWGCGSGRLTAHFLAAPGGPKVFGCDINARAIAWCLANHPGAEFRVVAPTPPLPYRDGVFDLVLAVGVVGWCAPDGFTRVLPDLRRLLTPQGLLLISVQGAFAASVRFPPDALAQLARDGYLDGYGYDDLHPPSPEDVLYRGGYYLTSDYVARTWTPLGFRVLEYLEGELNSDQDLILLQRTE